MKLTQIDELFLNKKNVPMNALFSDPLQIHSYLLILVWNKIMKRELSSAYHLASIY